MIIHNLTTATVACRENHISTFDLTANAPRTLSPGTTSVILFCPGDKVDGITVKLVSLGRIRKKPLRRLHLAGSDPKFIVFQLDREVLILPKRDTANFLKDADDHVRLSELCLPGTHETMALHGWPFAQCQSSSLLRQLEQGIRVIDIRLSVVGMTLIAYHDIISQKTPFTSILATLQSFLVAHPSETIIVSLKQENQGGERFNELLSTDIERSGGGWKMWFLEGRIPKLGEVRGKCVMFSRFGGSLGIDPPGWPKDKGLGIHPTNWPNSPREWFEWTCGDTTVRTQDWYNISSLFNIPEKAASTCEVMHVADPQSPLTLNISFASASSMPFALPPAVAKGIGWPSWGLGYEGVNGRIARFLLEFIVCQLQEHPSKIEGEDAKDCIQGWMLLDFYNEPFDELVSLLIECNYRGGGRLKSSFSFVNDRLDIILAYCK